MQVHHLDHREITEYKSTILLLVSHDQNRKLLKEYIPETYNILSIEDFNSSSEFDICIVDIQAYNKYQSLLRHFRSSEASTYLPIILLSQSPNLSLLSSETWKEVDDILQIPMSISVLINKLNIHQRTRSFSLQMEIKNKELKENQEILQQKNRELQKAQNQLWENNQKLALYKKAIDSTNTGITIADAQKKDQPLIFANKGFYHITGYSEEETIGRNCRFLQGNDNNQEEVENIHDALKFYKEGKAILRNYTKEGELFWNELIINPIKNARGETTHFVGIQNDVTELVKIQERLRVSLNEKEVLLQEIHHRVKNNLAVISSLLEMQEYYTENEELHEILESSKNRIRSMALIHESLYQTESFSDIQFDEYLENLTNRLYDISNDVKKVDFNLKCPRLYLNVNQAIPCALIINELISNSLKHAFKDIDNRKVDIIISSENSSLVSVLVADNGNGFPSEFLSNMETPKSYGFVIIQTLISQLNAELDIKNKSGACIQFSFKKETLRGAASTL